MIDKNLILYANQSIKDTQNIVTNQGGAIAINDLNSSSGDLIVKTEKENLNINSNNFFDPLDFVNISGTQDIFDEEFTPFEFNIPEVTELSVLYSIDIVDGNCPGCFQKYFAYMCSGYITGSTDILPGWFATESGLSAAYPALTIPTTLPPEIYCEQFFGSGSYMIITTTKEERLNIFNSDECLAERDENPSITIEWISDNPILETITSYNRNEAISLANDFIGENAYKKCNCVGRLQ